MDGFTPPNQHRAADEVFAVLFSEGIATVGDNQVVVKLGSVLLLRPGHSHAVRNTGHTRLHYLTTMVPDEDFARLIVNGVPDSVDAQDRAVLGWA